MLFYQFLNACDLIVVMFQIQPAIAKQKLRKSSWTKIKYVLLKSQFLNYSESVNVAQELYELNWANA